MASTQGTATGSFDFSEFISEEPQMSSENTEASNALPVRADASVQREQTATESRQASEEIGEKDKPSIASQEGPDHPDSSGSGETISNGKTVFQHPDESGQHVPEPVKRPQANRSSQSKDRSASLPPGVDPENNVNSKKLMTIPPASTVPTSSYSLRNRSQSKLAYDVKYHPMDDAIRPSQAAKRRSAHGEKPVFDSDDSSEASSIFETDAGEGESSDAQSEEAEEAPKPSTKRKARKQTKSRPLPAEGTRRSTRKVASLKTSYNMDVHPQDKYLVISSDDDERPAPSNKRKKLAPNHTGAKDDGEDSEPDEKLAKTPRTSRRKRSRRADLDPSDGLDSSGAPVLSSTETSNDGAPTAPTIDATSSHLSSVFSPPSHGIRRREGMDAWHYPPGKRYLNHDRYYWSVLPAEPFEIFEEKLEDQLAREAMEASPLKYEHDDKENSGNAGLEPLSDESERMSVIPVAQYRQSSNERQLSEHHDLVSSALYSDDAPQSYGLDGADSTDEVRENDISGCMDILASGQCLPPGQKQPEEQTETQDSVLGPNLFNELTGSES